MKNKRRLYPCEELRKRLEAMGVESDAQEARKLRTLLYRRGTPPPIGASADQMARMVLSTTKQPGAAAAERPSASAG